MRYSALYFIYYIPIINLLRIQGHLISLKTIRDKIIITGNHIEHLEALDALIAFNTPKPSLTVGYNFFSSFTALSELFDTGDVGFADGVSILQSISIRGPR